MWAKLKASCLHSLTVAWTYIQLGAAAFMLNLDGILDQAGKAVGDPNLVQQLKDVTPPKWAGYLVGFIGVITLMTRLRSIVKKVG